MTQATAQNYAPAEKPPFLHDQVADWWGDALIAKGETALLHMVRAAMAAGFPDDPFPGIPFNRLTDTVRFEYRLPNGRADIVIFHMDGSATLIEAKDGRIGMHNVLSGIGQAVMYAIDLSLVQGRPKTIRRALLWNSTGKLHQDLLIELACEQAGVLPMQFGPLDPQLESARNALESQTHGA